MKCSRCHLDKGTEEFYTCNKWQCKSCVKKKYMEWCDKNPDKVRAKRQRYRDKNKEEAKEYYRGWYKKNGRKRDPIKQAAHTMVAEAIRKGIIVRPTECSVCNDTNKIEGHHNDYYQPLEVIWLCNRCHRKLHPGS